VAARSKVWVCGRSLAGIWVRILLSARVSVVSVVCCQVAVSAMDPSLVQRSPTECGVSEYDLVNLTRRHGHTRPYIVLLTYLIN
jgi:hypothetical protein